MGFPPVTAMVARQRAKESSPFAAPTAIRYEFFLDAGATNLELTKVRSTKAHSGL
jgi:hypothetical protein